MKKPCGTWFLFSNLNVVCRSKCRKWLLQVVHLGICVTEGVEFAIRMTWGFPAIVSICPEMRLCDCQWSQRFAHNWFRIFGKWWDLPFDHEKSNRDRPSKQGVCNPPIFMVVSVRNPSFMMVGWPQPPITTPCLYNYSHCRWLMINLHWTPLLILQSP